MDEQIVWGDAGDQCARLGIDDDAITLEIPRIKEDAGVFLSHGEAEELAACLVDLADQLRDRLRSQGRFPNPKVQLS